MKNVQMTMSNILPTLTTVNVVNVSNRASRGNQVLERKCRLGRPLQLLAWGDDAADLGAVV